MKRAGYAALAALILSSLSGCEEAYRSAPAPVINLGLQSDSRTGSIIVDAHDTLWSISQRYRLPLRAIIDLNRLAPPYKLQEHQRLRLPPPTDYRVRNSDTLQSVADIFGVSESQLVATNHIQAPYRISAGQVLRIPYSIRPAAPQTEPQTMTAQPSSRMELPPSVPRLAQEPVVSESLAPPSRPVSPSGKAAPAARIATTLAPSQHTGFVWPVRGKIISAYGAKGDGLFNDGVNIAAPRGAAVVAAADGVVAYVGRDLKSYGNLILVRHSGGIMTAYAHLDAARVRKGAVLRRGQVIGTVGSSGSVSASQLHFEIRHGSKTYNPQNYM